jgi:hypothetical protein
MLWWKPVSVAKVGCPYQSKCRVLHLFACRSNIHLLRDLEATGEAVPIVVCTGAEGDREATEGLAKRADMLGVSE